MFVNLYFIDENLILNLSLWQERSSLLFIICHTDMSEYKISYISRRTKILYELAEEEEKVKDEV